MDGSRWKRVHFYVDPRKRVLSRIDIKKEPVENINGFLLAEREGFEPPVPLSTAVFKTAVIDHSTISPRRIVWS